jgi:hypothetical protein
MTRIVQTPPPPSDFTPPKQLGGGPDLKFMRDIWTDLAVSQCRVDMFRALARLDIGVNETEDFNAAQNLKFRSSKFKFKGCQKNRNVVDEAMRSKLRDAICTRNEVSRERDKLRRQLKKTYGQKTVKTRKILRELNTAAQEKRKELREYYKEKIDHLKKKNQKRKQEERSLVPEDVKDYSSAKVFDEQEYEKIEVETIEVGVIGQVELSEEEKAVLRLHPKFSVRDIITVEILDFEQELGNAKLRYELRKENEENLIEEEEKFGGADANTATFASPPQGPDIDSNTAVSVEELGEEMEARAREKL